MSAPRKPMKAEDFVLESLRFPYLASAKLDGYRCFNHEAVPRTSSGTPITNRHTCNLFAGGEFEGLDGELIVGPWNARDAFWQTSGPVRRKEGEPEVKWYIFDDRTIPDEPFHVRNKSARERVQFLRANGHRDVLWIPHVEIASEPVLVGFEEQMLNEGFEGVMLRDPTGPYKFGRSTVKENYLLKVKRFITDEAVILALEEQVENLNASGTDAFGRAKKSTSKDTQVGTGMVGAFLVKSDKWADSFRVSASSLTHKERERAWRNPSEFVGEQARFKYFPHGTVDVPRHGVFEGLRGAEDIGNDDAPDA